MKFTCAVLTTLMLAVASPAPAAFVQGFEADTNGWVGATRVSSGTHGVPSQAGGFHAEDQNLSGLTYTFWGGDSRTFPPGGYTTSVDIYLDIAPPYLTGSVMPYANDTRFDWSSAIGTPQCGHRRDFVFNAGFYTDVDITGAGPRFVISASTNATRSAAFPKNPGRDPFTINVEGWYTFEHRFYAVPPGPGGVLRVDLTIKNALGVPLKTWTLSDPSDIIGTTVGGNQYGWFVINEFSPALAFDNSALVGFQDLCEPVASTPGAKVTGGGFVPKDDSKATFGLTAKANASGTPSGHLTYQDHAQNRTVQSTSITSVVVNGQCATVRGTAKVNGAGAFGFEVTACDNGEPGTGSDTFSITMSDGYSHAGTLDGGNVQLH